MLDSQPVSDHCRFLILTISSINSEAEMHAIQVNY